MGKTRPPERSKLARKQKRSRPQSSQSPKDLLTQASAALEQSETNTAFSLATNALKILKNAIKTDEDALACLPALTLLGQICVELGDISAARKYFSQATDLDPDGDLPESQGGGPDKFLWLAQLSEEGGQDAVQWFEKAANVLRRQILEFEDEEDSEMEDEHDDKDSEIIESKRHALASALCAITEIYMTDLSFLPNAEEACSKAMEEAFKVAPKDPETLQTAASVRISQNRREEAQKILKKSLDQWQDLDPQDSKVPAFAVRISLARLLMEAEMEQEAKDVVEGLIVEDDMSVEAWYLGGFCRYLIANRSKQSKNMNGSGEETISNYQRGARIWLRRCLKLYELQEYEDERLRDHAIELLEELTEILGDHEPIDANQSDEEWEDEESENSEGDTDEEMNDDDDGDDDA